MTATCVILLKAQPKASQFRVTAMNEAFEKISVGEDVKVVLTEWPGKSMTITGKPEAEISITNGVLNVKKQTCCKRGSVTVHIPVQKIKPIELNEGASAYSDGQLQSDNLTVYVKGAAYFELKSRGMINVVYDEELELDIRKVRNEKLLRIAAGK